jgi:hypothetical protein
MLQHRMMLLHPAVPRFVYLYTCSTPARASHSCSAQQRTQQPAAASSSQPTTYSCIQLPLVQPAGAAPEHVRAVLQRPTHEGGCAGQHTQHVDSMSASYEGMPIHNWALSTLCDAGQSRVACWVHCTWPYLVCARPDGQASPAPTPHHDVIVDV